MSYDFICLSKRFLIILFLLGFYSPKILSQKSEESSKIQYQKNEIVGKVIDETGQPVSYANVILYSLPDSVFMHGVSTNSDGQFLIKVATQISCFVQLSRIGYKKTYINVTNNNLGIIQLKTDTNSLNDVVITAQRKIIKLENGKLVTDVANSALSKENNAIDVLRKLPGMMIKDGELVTFTNEKPDIYINGKKIQSINEVKQLEVKNIKEIKLNNNPGAEYDAATSTVLEIKTFKKEEGLSLQIDGNIDRNHVWQHGEAIKANYKAGGLNIFGAFSFNKYGKISHQNIDHTIATTDTIWNNSTNTNTNYDMRYYTYSIGSNYDFNNRHSIGIMYDGYIFTKNDKAPFNSDVLANNISYANITGQSALKNKEDQHHINAFYSGTFGKLLFNVYADYANDYLQRDQAVSENSLKYGQSNTNLSNSTNYNVYALNPKVTYTFNPMHKLNLGADLSLVKGKNDLSYSGSLTSGSKSNANESKWAEYISYNFDNGAFSIDAGLRFERIKYKYNDLIESKNDIDKKYNNIFPSIGIFYKRKAISQSLNYRISTIRPMFEQLNNSSYYGNRFNYQEGNPALVPQISHQIKYSFVYNFIYISLGYDYNKDYIDSYYTTKKNEPEVFVNTWKNYGKQQRITSVVNLQHKFNFFEPSLTVTFTKNIQDFEYMDKAITVDKPFWQIYSDNNFYLPAKFIFDIEYQYQSKGSDLFFTFFPTHTFNLSLSKSFLNGNLNISLQGTDIFRKYIYTYEGRINNIYFWQRDDEDVRSISLHCTWRFNNYKNKYKGESAAVDELKRL